MSNSHTQNNNSCRGNVINVNNSWTNNVDVDARSSGFTIGNQRNQHETEEQDQNRKRRYCSENENDICPKRQALEVSTLGNAGAAPAQQRNAQPMFLLALVPVQNTQGAPPFTTRHQTSMSGIPLTDASQLNRSSKNPAVQRVVGGGGSGESSAQTGATSAPHNLFCQTHQPLSIGHPLSGFQNNMILPSSADFIAGVGMKQLQEVAASTTASSLYHPQTKLLSVPSDLPLSSSQQSTATATSLARDNGRMTSMAEASASNSPAALINRQLPCCQLAPAVSGAGTVAAAFPQVNQNNRNYGTQAWHTDEKINAAPEQKPASALCDTSNILCEQKFSSNIAEGHQKNNLNHTGIAGKAPVIPRKQTIGEAEKSDRCKCEKKTTDLQNESGPNHANDARKKYPPYASIPSNEEERISCQRSATQTSLSLENSDITQENRNFLLSLIQSGQINSFCEEKLSFGKRRQNSINEQQKVLAGEGKEPVLPSESKRQTTSIESKPCADYSFKKLNAPTPPSKTFSHKLSSNNIFRQEVSSSNEDRRSCHGGISPHGAVLLSAGDGHKVSSIPSTDPEYEQKALPNFNPRAPTDEGKNSHHPEKALSHEDGKQSILSSPLPRCSLALDDDHNWLSEYHCFVRAELLEVFKASAQDVKERKSSKSVCLEQVGIRCKHCAGVEYASRVLRSSAFPSRINQIYQSFNMMVRDHFGQCPFVPKAIKAKFLKFKEMSSTGDTISRDYWNHSAAKLGMIDTTDGIAMNDESKAAALDIPPFGVAQGKEPAIEPPVMLVSVEDRDLISKFLFALMSQVQLVYLLPAERKGRRKNLRLGMPGFGCIHCCRSGRLGFCRIFPLSEDKLSSKMIDLLDHLRRCPICPKDVKKLLLHYLKADKQVLAFNDQEIEFFRRVWSRLNANAIEAHRVYHSSASKNLSSSSTAIRSCEDANWSATVPHPLSSTSSQMNPSSKNVLSLELDDDHNWLSEYYCFIRSEFVEVFEAGQTDLEDRKNTKSVVLKQVGIRCKFCADFERDSRVSRSSAFPSHTRKIYQSLSMMARDHFGNCPVVPPEIKKKFQKLKDTISSGDTISKDYWHYSAAKLGLIDTEKGIVMTEESRKKAILLPPFGTDAGQEPVIEPPVLLVTSQDLEQVSQFLFFLLSQAQLVHMRPTERIGCRRTYRVGMPGFACRYCSSRGRLGLCRNFPSSRDKLSSKLIDLLNHLHRCPFCPAEVRKSLLFQLKSRDKISAVEADQEEDFLDRIWDRLNK